MERAHGLGLRSGIGRNRIIPFSLFLSFFRCVSLSSFIFHSSAGTKGSGGGAPPSSRLARRRRGFSGSCHTLIRVNTV